PRPPSRPGQPRLGRASEDSGGEVGPRVQPTRRHVGSPGPPRVGCRRHTSRRPGGGVLAVRLGVDDDRRDLPCRRRLPRHGDGPTIELGLFLTFEYQGTPAPLLYADALDLVEAAEGSGYSSAWTVQQHFSPDYGRLPAPLP